MTTMRSVRAVNEGNRRGGDIAVGIVQENASIVTERWCGGAGGRCTPWRVFSGGVADVCTVVSQKKTTMMTTKNRYVLKGHVGTTKTESEGDPISYVVKATNAADAFDGCREGINFANEIRIFLAYTVDVAVAPKGR